MRWPDRYRTIALTGPESTGKTTLALRLAGISGGICVPEYARTYVAGLKRKYVQEDLEHISQIQIREYDKAVSSGNFPIIFDTFLFITKIWFVTVYGSSPLWLDKEIRRCAIDVYLLCYPDLPWEPDAVRENPGHRRFDLYQAYKTELERSGRPFHVIQGSGEKRIENCLALLECET